MSGLKLLALDDEDLAVISAQVQDAVSKPELIEYLPQQKRFTLVINRFAWDAQDKTSRRAKNFERRRALLSFARVLGVRTKGIDRKDKSQVLSLLAIRFEPAEAPVGTLEMVFSGGALIQLDVECVEVQLMDLSAAWETKFKPRHPLT